MSVDVLGQIIDSTSDDYIYSLLEGEEDGEIQVR